MQGQYHNIYGDVRMIKPNSLPHQVPVVPDMSMNQLPPLSMLPQWNRVNTLDKSRYPKPFIRDRVQPLSTGRGEGEDQSETEISNMNPAQRASYLERSIKFLKQQHQEILKCLHEEIDTVKKENKDLQFRLVMNEKRRRSSRKHDKKENLEEEGIEDDSASMDAKYLENTEKSREVKVIFLNEEIKELKHALRETVNTNTYLKQLVEQHEDHMRRQSIAIEKLKDESANGPQTVLYAEQVVAGENLFNPQSSQQPTLGECQGIIKHLKQVNEKQSHELEGLKSDLRDVLYSHKWTPDAYLLAKAYVADDEVKEESKSSKSALPRIALKHPTRKLPDIAYIQRDQVSLPALKQTIGNKATERQKRAQIVQKSRYREELLK